MANINITFFDIEEGRAGTSRKVRLKAKPTFTSTELKANPLYKFRTELLGHDNGRQPDVLWTSTSYYRAKAVHNDVLEILDQDISSNTLNEDRNFSLDGPKDEVKARITISPYMGGSETATSHAEQDEY